MAEDRNSIDFRVRRKPEDLGRYLNKHDRVAFTKIASFRFSTLSISGLGKPILGLCK